MHESSKHIANEYDERLSEHVESCKQGCRTSPLNFCNTGWELLRCSVETSQRLQKKESK